MNTLFEKRMRFRHQSEQNRAIYNKQKTLEDALNRSYFGFDVTKPEFSTKIKYRALIERDDEDEQIISCFFEDDIKVGTIVHWIRTNTYWLVHEQDYNEIAFFKGKMIECKNYQITTEDGKFSTWGKIALKANTSENTYDKTLVSRDSSLLTLWIPHSDMNKTAFKLGTKISLLDYVWEISELDYITKNGILIITAEKTTATAEVDINENDIVNDNTYIDGPNFIAPLERATYYIADGIEGEWSIPDNKYIQKIINSDNSVDITWTNARKRNDFTISYGEYSKEIHVKSLM